MFEEGRRLRVWKARPVVLGDVGFGAELEGAWEPGGRVARFFHSGHVVVARGQVCIPAGSRLRDDGQGRDEGGRNRAQVMRLMRMSGHDKSSRNFGLGNLRRRRRREREPGRGRLQAELLEALRPFVMRGLRLRVVRRAHHIGRGLLFRHAMITTNRRDGSDGSRSALGM